MPAFVTFPVFDSGFVRVGHAVIAHDVIVISLAVWASHATNPMWGTIIKPMGLVKDTKVK